MITKRRIDEIIDGTSMAKRMRNVPRGEEDTKLSQGVPDGELSETMLRVFGEETHNAAPGEKLKMVCDAYYIPKRQKGKPQGDDAHFLCVQQQTIGVADGVGGWFKLGIDGGEYARQLMSNSIIEVHNEPLGLVDPKRVLQRAFSCTQVEGSSTACIITLKDNTLCAANVGDSGFMLFRDNKFIYKSQVQQRSFNHPYQLGKSHDNPNVAAEIKITVKEGDVVIIGSDGLFDNMSWWEMERLLGRCGEGPLHHLAWKIADFALFKSFQKDAITPFSLNARNSGIKRTGGKVDDITVIVSRIVSIG